MRGLLRCGLVISLLLGPSLAAQISPNDLQDAASPATPCDSLAPDMPHADAVRKVCEYAMSIPQKMPNFTCEQKTSRFRDEHVADVITAEVTYEDGKESFRELKSNGQPLREAGAVNTGTWSTGQFGASVRAIFNPANKVTFQFMNQGKIRGRRALTFQYKVAHQNLPLWRLHVEDEMVAPPYHGQLWIDEETGNLLQLQMVATDLPSDFPLRDADLDITYDEVPFGDGTSFVLPLKSVVNGVGYDKRHNRNVLEFRNCHKFRATARILPQ